MCLVRPLSRDTPTRVMNYVRDAHLLVLAATSSGPDDGLLKKSGPRVSKYPTHRSTKTIATVFQTLSKWSLSDFGQPLGSHKDCKFQASCGILWSKAAPVHEKTGKRKLRRAALRLLVFGDLFTAYLACYCLSCAPDGSPASVSRTGWWCGEGHVHGARDGS